MVKGREKTCEIQSQLYEFHLLPNMNLQSTWIWEWQLQAAMKFRIIHTELIVKMKVLICISFMARDGEHFSCVNVPTPEESIQKP
jgi:hypothetical protein